MHYRLHIKCHVNQGIVKCVGRCTYIPECTNSRASIHTIHIICSSYLSFILCVLRLVGSPPNKPGTRAESWYTK